MTADQWTVEEALRWIWFAGDAFNPVKLDYLNSLADPFSTAVCEVDGTNACGRMGVTSGMHLRVMGLPLKEKLSSGELAAIGSAGGVSAAPAKIHQTQWDAISRFDIDDSAALDRRGNVVFVGLRISQAANHPAPSTRQTADQAAIQLVLKHLGWLNTKPLKTFKQMAAEIQRYNHSNISDAASKAAFNRLEQKSQDTLERSLSRFFR